MAELFILESIHSENDIFIKEYNDPSNFGDLYKYGKPINEIKESAQFFYPYKTNRKTDFLFGIFSIPIVSERFRQIIVDSELKNTEFYPVDLICKKTGEIDKSYKFLNILNNIACFDWQLAEYEVSPLAPKVILGINKLAIVEEPTKDRHIFRLNEYKSIVLISKKLKQIIEQEKLTGLRIIGIDDYGKK